MKSFDEKVADSFYRLVLVEIEKLKNANLTLPAQDTILIGSIKYVCSQALKQDKQQEISQYNFEGYA